MSQHVHVTVPDDLWEWVQREYIAHNDSQRVVAALNDAMLFRRLLFHWNGQILEAEGE